MNINIVTMFPEILDGFCKNPIVKRAIQNGNLNFSCVDIKEHTDGCYRKLDDSPCGGGKGMILRVDAVVNALNKVRNTNSHVVLLSPKGTIFNQEKAKRLATEKDLVFVCGHYEGYDARIESYVDECISLGDYILSGGENAAAVVCDSIVRLIPGVLKEGVSVDESFESGLLEYNQYTHPVEYNGESVPSVLLSGNQAEIKKFKEVSSLVETAKYRPDLLFKYGKPEPIGRSSASILMFDDYVVKIDDNSSLQRETDVLRWMNGKVPVPDVFEVVESDKTYLIMERIKGKMLCDSYYLNNPVLLVKTAAKALKNLWNVDISTCSFDSCPDSKLAVGRKNIDEKRVSYSDSDFDSAESLYKWLVSHKPETDAVFSHGDFCLPNIIVSDKKKINYIDTGYAGVGDRYCDIALCLRSMEYNLAGRSFDENLFFDTLEISPDYEKIRWYKLMDELF